MKKTYLLNFVACVTDLFQLLAIMAIILSFILQFPIEGLLLCSLVPIKPGDDKPRWLSKEEKAKFTLSSELKDILIGLCLGDLYIYKQRLNVSLMFRQGIVHEDYLLHLFELFKNFGPSPLNCFAIDGTVRKYKTLSLIKEQAKFIVLYIIELTLYRALRPCMTYSM